MYLKSYLDTVLVNNPGSTVVMKNSHWMLLGRVYYSQTSLGLTSISIFISLSRPSSKVSTWHTPTVFIRDIDRYVVCLIIPFDYSFLFLCSSFVGHSSMSCRFQLLPLLSLTSCRSFSSPNHHLITRAIIFALLISCSTTRSHPSLRVSVVLNSSADCSFVLMWDSFTKNVMYSSSGCPQSGYGGSQIPSRQHRISWY